MLHLGPSHVAEFAVHSSHFYGRFRSQGLANPAPNPHVDSEDGRWNCGTADGTVAHAHGRTDPCPVSRSGPAPAAPRLLGVQRRTLGSTESQVTSSEVNTSLECGPDRSKRGGITTSLPSAADIGW